MNNRSRSLDTDERKYNVWNMMPIRNALNDMQRKQATLCIDLNKKDVLIRI